MRRYERRRGCCAPMLLTTGLVAAMLAGHAAGQQQTWYVDADAQGAANGQSWPNAWPDLQAALTSLDVDPGDKIWVADGTYTPLQGITSPPEPRDASFVLIPQVAVYGGFLGDEPGGYETDESERDHYANETTLSGEIDDPGGADNSYHVVYAHQCGSDTRIDGFTVKDGNAEGDTGGGMYAWGYDGGIIRCTFQENHATCGGGVYIRDGGDGPSNESHILNCRFRNNGASGGIGSGGGVSVGDLASAVVANTLFHDNTVAGFGGAVFGMFNAYGVELINCTIADNQASVGGGVYLNDDLTGAVSGAVRNCILWGNTASGSHPQLWYDEAEVDVSYNCIENWSSPGTNGNIDDDPLFRKTSDYRLQTASPCIDTGHIPHLPNDAYDLDYDDITTAESIPMDLEGHTRIMGGLQDTSVDMGAYEYFVCLSDVNGDLVVDVLDLLAVLAAWGQTGTCPEDVNNDGIVNVLDLLQVLADWGCGNPVAPQEAPQSVQDCIDKYGDDIEQMIGCIEAILLTEE